MHYNLISGSEREEPTCKYLSMSTQIILFRCLLIPIHTIAVCNTVASALHIYTAMQMLVPLRVYLFSSNRSYRRTMKKANLRTNCYKMDKKSSENEELEIRQKKESRGTLE